MRHAIGGMTILVVVLMGFGVVQAEPALTEADALYDAGGLANYLAAIPLYEKAVAESGDNYEALWKCARAHRDYGNKVKQQGGAGWEDLCAQHGKTGMGFAEKAIALAEETRKMEQRLKLLGQTSTSSDVFAGNLEFYTKQLAEISENPGRLQQARQNHAAGRDSHRSRGVSRRTHACIIR